LLKYKGKAFGEKDSNKAQGGDGLTQEFKSLVEALSSSIRIEKTIGDDEGIANEQDQHDIPQYGNASTFNASTPPASAIEVSDPLLKAYFALLEAKIPTLWRVSPPRQSTASTSTTTATSVSNADISVAVQPSNSKVAMPTGPVNEPTQTPTSSTKVETTSHPDFNPSSQSQYFHPPIETVSPLSMAHTSPEVVPGTPFIPAAAATPTAFFATPISLMASTPDHTIQGQDHPPISVNSTTVQDQVEDVVMEDASAHEDTRLQGSHGTVY
jgi:hypothetical protein